MFYSKSTKGFYTPEIHGDGIPSDAVEITDEHYFSLLDGQNNGKIIVSDAKGKPILADEKLTNDELKKRRISEIDSELLSNDLKMIRQNSAISIGVDTKEDRDRLSDLIAMNIALRAERILLDD